MQEVEDMRRIQGLLQVGYMQQHDNLRLIASTLIGWIAIPFFSFSWEIRLLLWWNILAFVYLVMTWLILFQSRGKQTRQWSATQSTAHPWLWNLLLSQHTNLILAMSASLVGVVQALFLIKNQQGAIQGQVLSAVGVLSAWLMLHTSYTLYYTYLYYRNEKMTAGILFPCEDAPDLMDFAYFSFTIGTTFATSDVEIVSKSVRRAVLGHSIQAFFYNTAILSVAISFFTR